MPQEPRIVLDRMPGMLRCMGLFFAGLGALPCVLILTHLGQPTVDEDGRPGPPTTAATAIFPGLFMALGLGIALIRYQKAVVGSRRAIVRRAGWGLWVRETEISLAEVTTIALRPVVERDIGSGRYRVIPVVAVGARGEQELAAPEAEGAAQVLAERIAQALEVTVGAGLPSSDAAVSPEVASRLGVVTAQELQPPLATRVRLEELPNGIALVLPAARPVRIGLFITGILLVGIVFWAGVWHPVLAANPEPTWLHGPIDAAPLILVALAAAGVLMIERYHGRLGDRLVVERGVGLRTRRQTIPAERIRAVCVVPDGDGDDCIQVVLLGEVVRVARAQSREDLRWIRAVVIEGLMRE